MARVKISELNEKTQLDDNDLIPVVDSINNETKKVKKSSLVNDVYSLNETLTKKVWTDGKPIYRKVVALGDLSDSSRYNNDNAIIVYGGIYELETPVSIRVFDQYSWYDITTYLWWDNYNLTFGLMTFSGYVSYVEGHYNEYCVYCKARGPVRPGDTTDAYAILEYTKTTD